MPGKDITLVDEERKRLNRAFGTGLSRFKNLGIYGAPTPELEAAARARFFTLCTNKTTDPRFMAHVKSTSKSLGRLACIVIGVEHKEQTKYRKTMQ